MREHLTDRFAASISPSSRIERYFDTTNRTPRGFLLRVTPAGARVWAMRYRVADSGRERELTIGAVESWPVAEARKRGHELRREIDAGGDPLGDREEKRAAPSVAELAERFIAEALARRAPRTQAEYRAQLRDWILPALGRKKVDSVACEDIEKLHAQVTKGNDKLSGGQRRANSVKSLVSVLFNQAIVWKMRPPHTNPAELVKNNDEHGRERYLGGEELARLVAVLDRWREKRPDSVDAISLATLTGARRGEILGMMWSQIEGLGTDTVAWNKPASLTKDRKPHRTPLSEAAALVLHRRQAERAEGPKIVRLRDNDHVFRGAGSKTHCNTLERDWYQIRAAAGLEDVRFHDLRHTFASTLVGENLSLEIIGRLLGHAKSSTTQRYAHLADKPLRDAAELISRKVRP
jgi:integrase